MADTRERKSRLLGSGEIEVSFEFFPPKTEKMEESLWSAIHRLAPLCPQFVSVTYGAGGSTRERTHNTVARLVKETALKPAAHLTCVNASRAEVDPSIPTTIVLFISSSFVSAPVSVRPKKGGAEDPRSCDGGGYRPRVWMATALRERRHAALPKDLSKPGPGTDAPRGCGSDA